MSAFSILNNAQAASALFNLGKTQNALDTVQQRINTGLRVGSAKDNASSFSVSLGMKNDVAGFKAIRETMALGKGTVDTAMTASETVSDLLGQLKDKVVQAQSENVDRAALQRDISQIRDQINTIVSSAQFNGVNLVGDSAAAASGKTLKVLASLDRESASAAPTPSFIEIAHQNISTSELGKTATTDAIDTIDVNRTDLGKTAGVAEAYVDVNGLTPAAGDEVVITVQDQSGTRYQFTMTGAAGGSADNQNIFDTTNLASALGDIVANLQNGNVQGVEIDDAGNVVSGGETINFSDTGLTVASAGGGTGFTITDGAEADAFSMVQDATTAPVDVSAFGAGSGTVGTQTFEASSADATAGFSSSTIDIVTTPADNSTVTLNLTGPNGEDLSVTLTTNSGGATAGNGTDFDGSAADLASELQVAIETAATNAGLSQTNLVDLGLAIETTGTEVTVRSTGTTDGVAVRGFEIADSASAAADLTAKSSVTVSNDRSFALTIEGEIAKVESAVQQMQEVTATFGSMAQRLEMQDKFLESLTNTLNDGISSLVDANMAEESARFQALQVQQQLGLQALSIANQQPQAVLGLFR